MEEEEEGGGARDRRWRGTEGLRRGSADQHERGVGVDVYEGEVEAWVFRC
jgi:hypothetical protein